jgi:queuine/archaeosine tRNA-ribosyltransferase
MQVSDDRFQAELGCSILTLLGERPSENCNKITNAKRTVENSLRWAENMPETCRVL